MLKDLSNDKMNALIKFKKKFIFLKNKCDKLNQEIFDYKDILMGMLTNLSYFNNLKMYQETDSNYLAILNELQEIKNLLDEFPYIITIKNLKEVNHDKLLKIYMLIKKYMNHITSDNFNLIMQIFAGKDWLLHISKDNLDKILFISKFIRPICIWDSDEHWKEIPIKSINGDLIFKPTLITKELLEAILGFKKPDGEVSSMPIFLKNLTDMVEIGPKKQILKRNNQFNKLECVSILEKEDIKFTKNTHCISLLEDKYGVCIYFRIKKKFIVIQGIFKDDLLNLSNSISFVKSIKDNHEKKFNSEMLNIPNNFKEAFLKTLSLRDKVINTITELLDDLKKKYNDYKILQGKPLLSLINEFMLVSKFRKIDILTLLLMSNEDDQKLAYVLFDLFRSKDKKDISQEIYNSLHYSIRELLDISKTKIEKEDIELNKFTESDLPYERRIAMLKCGDDVKSKAMEKLKSIKSSFQGDSKAQHWLDGLLKIPFNQYKDSNIMSFKENFIKKIDAKLFSDNDVDKYINNLRKTEASNNLILEWDTYKILKKEYLINVRKVLNNAVFGHKEAKVQLERIFAQWINGEAKGAILGLKGPPGTGKTSLAKNGLSKCLMDNNGESRPFVFLPIGGSVNGSTLVGHNFTYVGSTWGRIADILMSTKCMNPIIFIDEVDKVSHTEHGREIISILTHLTDATQNDEFEDKFFSGIKLNLSKALIVFSFNDINLIDPILRDRITVIETNPLSINEKLTIIKDYMLPEICKEVGFNKEEIIISDDLIKHLIETYTNEAGVRKIKEKIVELIRDINLNRFHKNDITLPFTITEAYMKELFENYPKVRVKKIPKEPSVGLVNGLYATTSGIGGITNIEVIKFPSDKMLELNITGQTKEVMTESINYALKNAYRLLTPEEQEKIIEDHRNKKTFGIHVHCPDGATPKDGPSAGLAFTLAIYSLLSGKKVRNDICMTGETNLNFEAMIIGGLEAKLNGGKKAGCKLALIPEEHMEDLEIMRREGKSPEDGDFRVVAVRDVYEVIRLALV